MFLTLLLCTCYCLAMTVTLGYYWGSPEAFTGMPVGARGCFYEKGSEFPLDHVPKEGAVNYNRQIKIMVTFGFFTHLAGFLADGGMAIRVYSKNKIFNLVAIIACCIYSVFWLAWIIWLHVERYGPAGKACSAEYLNTSEPQEYYAIR